MLNLAYYYRFSDYYSDSLKTIDHLSFKLQKFSVLIASFKIRVLKVQDFGNFELSPMCVTIRSRRWLMIWIHSIKRAYQLHALNRGS